ncbi:hypothetical protein HZS_4201, partial [Henneguya salminicola]
MSPRIEKSPLRCDIAAEQTPPSKRKTVFNDRFIPSQARRAIDFSTYLCTGKQKHKKDNSSEISDKSKEDDSRKDFSSIQEKQYELVYKTLLKNELCETRPENIMKYDEIDYNMDTSDRSLVFTYKESLDCKPSVFSTSPRIPYCYANQKIMKSDIQEYRRISRHPFKVLDAPGLPNDYYLNLLDWSRNDVVAVALGNKVYLWEFSSCKVTNLMESFDVDNNISCVRWCHDNPNLLSFTTTNGMMYLYDVKADKCIQKKHISCNQRVGCMDWNGNVISTGSRDGIIRNYDIREDAPILSHSAHGHILEVCGLKWDPSGKILASGGNDNRIFLWNLNGKYPINSLNGHQGAVKALSWSPHEYGILASGGGSADRCIKFWNTKSHQLIKSIDTQSQVCNLHWSNTDKEIVSTHGFSSNAINLWSYPKMEKLVSLKGHTSRVVYMSCSPDGEKIVTGSADETLRFWNIFQKNNKIAC